MSSMLDVTELDAGEALNAAVAERVFGCTLKHEDGDVTCGCESQIHTTGNWRYSLTAIKDYSGDLHDAWGVVEQMRAAGWLVVVKAMPEGGAFLAGDDWTRDPKVKERYVCEIARLPYANDYEAHPQGQRAFWAGGGTAPEAICRAAVRVAAQKEKDGGG